MNKIAQVTFPRSGTQLIAMFLLKYFANNVFYPFENEDTVTTGVGRVGDSINEILKKVDGSNYHRAGKAYYTWNDFLNSPYIEDAPDDIDEINFVTCHYFRGDNEYITPDMKCLIQYRHPLFSAFSNMDWGYTEDCKGFIISFISQWKQFISKWVIEEPQRKNKFMIEYDSFVDGSRASKLYTLNAMVEFLTDKEADHALIERIFDFQKIERRKSGAGITITDTLMGTISKSKYKFFKKQEQSIYKELEMLNLKRIFK